MHQHLAYCIGNEAPAPRNGFIWRLISNAVRKVVHIGPGFIWRAALVVLEYPKWVTPAQRRAVEVGAGGKFLAPLDERQAQLVLGLVGLSVAVQGIGLERRYARAVLPRD